MEQISWQELVAQSCSESAGIFGEGSYEVRIAKEMIRSAYRAAVPLEDVQLELVEVMRRRGFEREHVQRQITRLRAAWSWAEPIEDQAADNLLSMVDDELASLMDSLEKMGTSDLVAERIRNKLVEIRRHARHARFLNGAQMDASEASLEVDPENGREVYVSRLDSKSG